MQSNLSLPSSTDNTLFTWLFIHAWQQAGQLQCQDSIQDEQIKQCANQLIEELKPRFFTFPDNCQLKKKLLNISPVVIKSLMTLNCRRTHITARLIDSILAQQEFRALQSESRKNASRALNAKFMKLAPFMRLFFLYHINVMNGNLLEKNLDRDTPLRKALVLKRRIQLIDELRPVLLISVFLVSFRALNMDTKVITPCMLDIAFLLYK